MDTMKSPAISGFVHGHAGFKPAHGYLWPMLEDRLDKERRTRNVSRVFELGCGSGAVANAMGGKGFEVTGIDPSEDGIQLASAAYPDLRLEFGSCYDDLSATYGQFPVLVSLEVIEHVYAPREFMRTAFSLLEPGGVALISTPYHGYLKNLALAVSGQMESHFNALKDNGHIKFWSKDSLGTIAEEAGFEVEDWSFGGRLPWLWKSMLIVLRKPAA